MITNGCKVNNLVDLEKCFTLVSYGGKKMSIKKGVQVVKQNIPTIMQTPCRVPVFDNYTIANNESETIADQLIGLSNYKEEEEIQASNHAQSHSDNQPTVTATTQKKNIKYTKRTYPLKDPSAWLKSTKTSSKKSKKGT